MIINKLLWRVRSVPRLGEPVRYNVRRDKLSSDLRAMGFQQCFFIRNVLNDQYSTNSVYIVGFPYSVNYGNLCFCIIFVVGGADSGAKLWKVFRVVSLLHLFKRDSRGPATVLKKIFAPPPPLGRYRYRSIFFYTLGAAEDFTEGVVDMSSTLR